MKTSGTQGATVTAAGRAVAQTSAAASRPTVTWVLAALALCMLLPSLGTSIANVALPHLAEVFGASFHQVQWVVLAYLLTTTALVVGVGRLGDIVGRRRLLLAGIVLFTVASTLGAAAPTLGLLIAARAAQGLGAAMMMALAIAFVGEAVPKARTGSAMGLLGSMSAIGTALGPTLGGVLIAAFGWPAIFVVKLPLGVLAGVLVWRCLPADDAVSPARAHGFDVTGTLLLAATLTAYGLAMTLGRGRFGMLNVALLLAAAVGVALFVVAEARARSPLIFLSMFREPVLATSLVMSALVSTVVMATLVVGPFYLAHALALAAAAVGAVMSAGPVAAALTGVPAGRIVDRFGTQRTTVAGLAAMVLGCVALGQMPGTPGAIGAMDVAGYVVPIVVMTAGYALFQTANNTAVMADVTPDRRGVVSGLLTLSRNLGLVTGASLMGAVFAWASRTSDFATANPAAIAAGMRTTFSIAAACVLVALVIALASRSHRQRDPTPA
jgi:MFS family permease